MKLHEVPKLLEQALEIEDRNERQQALQKLEMKALEKIENVVHFIKRKEDFVKQGKEEIKRIQGIIKTYENKADSTKEYLKWFMEENGIYSQDFPTFKLTIAQNPASINIVDEDEIPDKYKKEKVTITVDKMAIKEDIQKGEKVTGAELVTDKTNLRIR